MTVESGTGSGTRATVVEDAKPPALDEIHYGEFFIGGEWRRPSSSDRIDVVSPRTEQVIASVAAAVEEDIDAAVSAARVALTSGPWTRFTLEDRIRVLGNLSAEFERRKAEIASLVTEEMGCPIALSRVMQAGTPKMFIDSALEVATRYPWRETRATDLGTALISRRPVGVVAAIVPWNAPLSAAMLKLAPALVSGCTVVLKPAPETPLSAYLLADMLHTAGLPPGAVNIVAAGRRASEHLVGHPGVDKVAFTGSTVTGRRVAELCAQNFRRVTLELGGKSAAIVLDDADLDVVTNALRLGSFRNSGQVCSLKTRIIVSKRRHDEVVQGLIDLVKTMPVGDPRSEATEIGPLVTARQRDRVEGYIKAGSDEGASIVLGGGRPAHLARGWYVEPTIFTGVTRDARIAQEEIFGPVVSVLSADGEDDAVAIANSTSSGLNGAVFSADPRHALSVAERFDTGTVEINGTGTGRFGPMGGWKASGLGRENGPEGIDSFVEITAFGIPRETVPSAARQDAAR
jgi:acyl-CoA reductase-like NAD-dependent aldehyde dehydrogenase